MRVHYRMTATWRILEGDCRTMLRTLPERSVQTCVTSPPYFGLRDYGTGEWEGADSACDHLGAVRGSKSSTLKNDGRPNPGQNEYERDVRVPYRDECRKCGATRVDKQIGLEPTPDEFVQALVGVFRDDGTVWLNLGDSFCSTAPGTVNAPERIAGKGGRDGERGAARARARVDTPTGMKPKDLMGIPWMVAFALRADGWYLRSDIIWSKPNPMPESVTDRPTKAHEYVFLLSKGPRYFYDADAIRETSDWGRENNPEWQHQRSETNGRKHPTNRNGKSGGFTEWSAEQGRNKRSVWTVATQPYPGAHFATFPVKLIEPCILAGCPEGGTVLDPFAGAGTTGVVALRHNRSFIGIELNPEYVELARDRIIGDAPLLNSVAEAA
jgi:DNA modification methylase